MLRPTKKWEMVKLLENNTSFKIPKNMLIDLGLYVMAFDAPNFKTHSSVNKDFIICEPNQSMTKSLYLWVNYGGRIPRKLKKKILNRKPTKRLLRKMLSETVMGPSIRTMYERVEFIPYGSFCPKCGEKNYVGTGNRTSYPEHWEYFRCLRCRNVVGYIDNSPFIHALECKDNGYDPTF